MISLSKEMFVTLMDALKNIDKTMRGLETLLDTNIDDGPLPNAFDSIANMLVEEMELEIDDDIGPIIYHYALVTNWCEEPFELKIGEKSFKIKDHDSLYSYLYAKYAYDAIMQRREVDKDE